MNQEDKASCEAQIRPVSHKIRAKFFLEEGRFVASDEVHLQRLTDVWGDVRFTLWSQLEIDELLVDGQPAQFTYGGGELYRQIIVRKEKLPHAQEHIHLTVLYAGKASQEQKGSIHTIINPEIVSLSPTAFPWYPRFDRSIGSVADVIFVAPTGYTVVASGELVDVRNLNDDWVEWTWHTNVSGERFAFVIARYTSKSICVHDIPLSIHIFAEDIHEMNSLFEEAMSIFTFCSERLGKYPLEKFAIAALPDIIRGGYAEESFIKWQRGLLHTKSGLAHEIAHAWNICAKGRGGLWLEESLGEYVSHLYQEFVKSADIAQNTRASWALKYFDLVSKIEDYPLTDFHRGMEPDCYSLYYNKGAWIWHILRQVLGDDMFDEVLLEFHHRYLLKPVTIDNFCAVCEEIDGNPLSWFFQEWLGRTEVPMLEITDIVTTQVEDGFLTTGILRQQGDIYHLPVEIDVQMEEQNEIHRIWLESAEKRFEFKTNKRPCELVLDPHTNLLRAPCHNESLTTLYDTGRIKPIGRAAVRRSRS
jgi:aminopeptidase N